MSECTFCDKVSNCTKILCKSDQHQQLVVGGLFGGGVGYLGGTDSKKVALAIGCGLLLWQIANYNGFLKCKKEPVAKRGKHIGQKEETFQGFWESRTQLVNGFANGMVLGYALSL